MALIQQVVDEYGFIIMSEEARADLARYRSRMNHRIGGGLIGRGGSRCKGLCSLLPHCDGKLISFRRMGVYYCKDCGCVMKCVRCRCCKNIGRAEPRRRNRDYVKRID